MGSPEDGRQVEGAGLGRRSADGLTVPRSTVLSVKNEAIIAAFRRHMPPPSAREARRFHGLLLVSNPRGTGRLS